MAGLCRGAGVQGRWLLPSCHQRLSAGNILTCLVARITSVWQEEVEFEAQDVVCSVCEEAWAAERLEEHSELCAVLLQVGGGCAAAGVGTGFGGSRVSTTASRIEYEARAAIDQHSG